jgi:hypothetical protein
MALRATFSDRQLRKLAHENDRVQLLRSRNDLLEHLIFDQDGVQLRALVRQIGEYVVNTVEENTLFGQRQQKWLEQSSSTAVASVAPSSLAKQILSADNQREIKDMFARALDRNANDDKARMAQLQIIFFALTTLVDFRAQLMQSFDKVARFDVVDDRPAPKSVAERRKMVESMVREEQRRKVEKHNKIATRPLCMFLKNDARRLMSELLDSSNDSHTNTDTKSYVEQCIGLYLQYKEATTAELVADYVELAAAEAELQQK